MTTPIRRRFGLPAGTAALLGLLAGGGALAQDDADRLERLTALEARLASLEQEIRLLEDTKAIKRLQRAYGYYLDEGLTDEIAPLFAADATVEIGQSGVYVGRDSIAAYYRHVLEDAAAPGHLNNHLIIQGIVNVAEDGATAKGRWRALMQLGEHGESAIWGDGPYENEYVKEDGVWKFSKVHWYGTVIAPYDPGWHKAPMPLPGPSEELPPDRPPTEVYQSYPSAHLPPYHYDNPVSGRQPPR
ncbi:MAG: nuclear transport factor 2 family protein [Gammaproteobacteria bacterium]|nr:nuclear transport factor 2 family protein [Gammaproteobacteria bacterium]